MTPLSTPLPPPALSLTPPGAPVIDPCDGGRFCVSGVGDSPAGVDVVIDVVINVVIDVLVDVVIDVAIDVVIDVVIGVVIDVVVDASLGAGVSAGIGVNLGLCLYLDLCVQFVCSVASAVGTALKTRIPPPSPRHLFIVSELCVLFSSATPLLITAFIRLFLGCAPN